MNIEIRRLEPGDAKAVQRIFAQPDAMRGTLEAISSCRTAAESIPPSCFFMVAPG
jgi:hypothetical protein